MDEAAARSAWRSTPCPRSWTRPAGRSCSWRSRSRRSARRTTTAPRSVWPTSTRNWPRREELTCRPSWETEKQAIDRRQALKQQIEDTKHRWRRPSATTTWRRCAELKFGTLPGLEKQLRRRQRRGGAAGRHRLNEEVTEEEIAEVVSRGPASRWQADGGRAGEAAAAGGDPP